MGFLKSDSVATFQMGEKISGQRSVFKGVDILTEGVAKENMENSGSGDSWPIVLGGSILGNKREDCMKRILVLDGSRG
jgi:hypothetical protein